MTKSEKNSVEVIDKAIASLYATRESLLATLPLVERVKVDNWVIDETSGNPVYFQVNGISDSPMGFVALIRNGRNFTFSKDDFNKKFRLALKPEVEQHERYLATKKPLAEKPISKSEKWTNIVNNICDLTRDELFMIVNHVEIKKGSDFDSYYKTQMDRLKKIHNINTVLSTPAYDMNGSTTPPSNLPDFYMVTVRGVNGTKKRHETYEGAEKEAKRLAKQENHRATILGVVAVVDPLVDVQLTVTRK